MTHLFVTNDFPPKVGGIQTMLWELWRRLDPGTFTVLTTPYEGDRAWDAEQAYRVVRTKDKVLLPTPSLTRIAFRNSTFSTTTPTVASTPSAVTAGQPNKTPATSSRIESPHRGTLAM